MRQYGLIGYPLGHSFSPGYFAQKFANENIDASYNLFPLKTVDELPNLLHNTPNISGLNVTSPYKESVIKFTDYLSPEAEKIGAINTLVFTKNSIIGHNTDIFGFEFLLNKVGAYNGKALIFGTGGSSKAVEFVLKQRGIEMQFVSRNPSVNQLNYSDINKSIGEEHNIWINCTPVGQAPAEKQTLPLPFFALTKQHRVIDLVYNPTETLFLTEAKKHTNLITNGLEMLHQQAEKAWQLWCT